jgi:DNA-binding response OmpR family regulator
VRIERNGRESWFTPAEWRLLCVFLRNPGNVLSREELAAHAWGGVADEEGRGAVNLESDTICARPASARERRSADRQA